MPRRRWLRRLAAFVLLLALGVGAAGCGLKGPPKVPREPIVPGL